MPLLAAGMVLGGFVHRGFEPAGFVYRDRGVGEDPFYVGGMVAHSHTDLRNPFHAHGVGGGLDLSRGVTAMS